MSRMRFWGIYSMKAIAAVTAACAVPGIALASPFHGISGDIQTNLIVAFVTPFVYFTPTVIAATRDHPRSGTIFFVNLFFGWTVVGWIAALVWSMIITTPVSRRRLLSVRHALAARRFTPEMAREEAADLLIMKNKAIITEQEYAIGRKLIAERLQMLDIGEATPAEDAALPA